MPYLINEVTGDDVVKEATTKPPFGPGFNEKLAQQADRMEIWGSTFKDPGPDWCRFKLFNGEEELATVTVNGY